MQQGQTIPRQCTNRCPLLSKQHQIHSGIKPIFYICDVLMRKGAERGVCVCMCVCVHVCVCVCLCACIHTCAYVCVCVCVCLPPLSLLGCWGLQLSSLSLSPSLSFSLSF